MRQSIAKLAITTTLITSLTGCQPHNLTKNPDPYQNFNRKMFAFNDTMIQYIGDPATKAYRKTIPHFMRSSIHNFFENLDLFSDITNDTMQTNWNYLVNDTTRLILNSTLGLFGLIDVATHAGFPQHDQSFGLTLAKWGYKKSAYLVLPLLGPTTVRATWGRVGDMFSNPTTYIKPTTTKIALKSVDLFQTAAHLLPKRHALTENALDPYIAVRNAYLQNRTYLIKQINTDGKSPHNPHEQTENPNTPPQENDLSQKTNTQPNKMTHG